MDALDGMRRATIQLHSSYQDMFTAVVSCGQRNLARDSTLLYQRSNLRLKITVICRVEDSPATPWVEVCWVWSSERVVREDTRKSRL